MCNFRTNEIDLSEETDHEHSPPPEGERNCPLRSGARKPTGDSGESTGRGPSSGLIRLLLLLQRHPRGVRHSGQRVHHTPDSITSAQSTQVLKRRMQHSPLRRAPAAALVSVLSLVTSLLLGTATHADAATPPAQGVPFQPQQPYQPYPPGQGALPSTQASSSVHPGYPATPPPYQQGPDPMSPGTGGPSPQAGQNGYGRY